MVAPVPLSDLPNQRLTVFPLDGFTRFTIPPLYTLIPSLPLLLNSCRILDRDGATLARLAI